MKRTLGTLAVLVLAIRSALAATPAELNVVAFEDSTPLAQAIVEVDGDDIGATNADGSAQLRLAPGKRVLVLKRDGKELLRYEIEVAEGETAELIATLRAGRPPQIAVESSLGDGADRGTANTAPSAADAGPPGTLKGRIVSSENGAPIANARVFVSGTPLDLRTNANGEFQASVPAGAYAISVIAADYSAQTIDGLAVVAEQETTRDIELTPAGLMLPEFVVLEPYIEGSLAAFVEEKRTSFAVTEILGAEQISRAGDSDAASALRRVTGLTLVDGKFVYVRGLGERYSSVLLNGAQIPSPDPTRKVVPLDLFPTEILSGIVIQKTFTADMPGEFGGGTVQLRTKSYPDDFFFKLSGTLGYAQGTTGSDGLRYDGGSRDWTGYDSGDRDLPASIAQATAAGAALRLGTPPNGFSADQLNSFGRDLASNYNTSVETIKPNTGFTVSIGDSFDLPGERIVGYLGSVRYSQGWDTTDEIRRGFAPTANNVLVQTSELLRQKTERSIELSAFFNAGIEFAPGQSLRSTTVFLRQTTDEARVDEGYPEDPNDVAQFTKLEWVENELFAQQLGGEHEFPNWLGLVVDWQYTYATAARDAPNTREYRYELNQQANEFILSSRSDGNLTSFGLLDDTNKDALINLKLPIEFDNTSTITLLAGAQQLERSRESGIQRFQFLADSRDGSLARSVELRRNRPDVIFAPENFGPNGWTVRDATRPDDAYTADQSLDAVYLGIDGDWRDEFRVTVGARQEKNDQSARSRSFDGSEAPLLSEIATDDVLPSASAVWVQSEASQWRLGYSETVSRPEFRELTPAAFIDPLLDSTTLGNPDLLPASITSYDFRWEYYFSDSESLTIALFLKDFVNPIEQVQLAGSGELFSFANAASATNYGAEVDVYKTFGFANDWDWLDGVWMLGDLDWSKFYVSGNYAYIKSEVDLGASAGIGTNAQRPLQGQSPYVVNLQLGWQDPDAGTDWTLLFNRFGARISTAGTAGAPDVYEEPFGQLDFVFSQSLPYDLKLKLRLRNLLDPTVLFTQGAGVTREYKKGREVILSLEWAP